MRPLLKRWWFWVFLLSPLILCALTAVIFWPEETAERKYHKIAKGMSKEKILHIVGRGPDRVAALDPPVGLYDDSEGALVYEHYTWFIGKGELYVGFGEENIALHTGFFVPYQAPLLERIRNWIQIRLGF